MQASLFPLLIADSDKDVLFREAPRRSLCGFDYLESWAGSFGEMAEQG